MPPEPSYVAPFQSEDVNDALNEAKALLKKVRREAVQGQALDCNLHHERLHHLMIYLLTMAATYPPGDDEDANADMNTQTGTETPMTPGTPISGTSMSATTPASGSIGDIPEADI